MPYTELPPPSYEGMPPSSGGTRPLTDPLLSSSEATTRHRRHPSSLYDYSDQLNNIHSHSHSHSHSPSGRILDRDADFYQSRGRWSGVQLLPRATGRRNRSALSMGMHPSQRRMPCCGNCKRKLRQWVPRLWDDWFHTLAYQRTVVLMSILFVTYAGIVFAFGFVYLTISIMGATREKQPDGTLVNISFCDMDIHDHMEALYFSLSTMTTIGYGVSDYYFGGCWTPLLLVLLQVCTAITFDACAVGLLFTRLSRGRKRSKTVVVSNQAVVQVVQGTPYFMFRVGELRRFPLINVSVRLFCIRHERLPRLSPTVASSSHTYESLPIPETSQPPKSANSIVPVETTHFVTRPMTLLHPDATIVHANPILMSLPQVMVHRMDSTSPLVPPPQWYDAQGHCHSWPPPNPDQWLDLQQYALQEFWRDRRLEVVVLVEGTDELTGAAIQTRHSYMAAPAHGNANDNNNHHAQGDVVWNRAFVNCILPYPSNQDEEEEESGRNSQPRYQHPVCTVDFELFHDTVPVPRDCLASPYVPY
jgi:Inward rectifier potassium channel transmembrane domain